MAILRISSEISQIYYPVLKERPKLCGAAMDINWSRGV